VLYVPVVGLFAIGVVLLVIFTIRLFGWLRRFRRTTTMVVTDTQKRVGLLRARIAALRVAVAQRKGVDNRAARRV